MTSALDRLQAIDKPPRPPSPVKKRGVIVSVVAAIGLMLVKLKGAVFVAGAKPAARDGLEQLDGLRASPATLRLVSRVQERTAAFVYSVLATLRIAATQLLHSQLPDVVR